MEQPGTVTEAEGTPAGPRDHRGGPPSPGGPAERFPVALVRGATPGPGEVPQQLRKRLRFIALVAAAGTLTDLLIGLTLYGREVLAGSGEWAYRLQRLALGLAVTLLGLWAALHLARRRDYALRHLRSLEALLFAGVTAYFVQYDVGALSRQLDLLPRTWATTADASALPFVVLVVSYGVLIPNTWRRCAAAVGLFAACAYIGPAVGLALAPQPAGVAVLFLVEKTLWLGIAGGVAVYGAYRIEAVREQAERGRELGQYRLGRPLGAGGMGEVYLAEHRLLRRPCAIKLIRPERAGDPESLARFEREVRATATLTHPNTVQIFDYGRAEDGTFYYVMEYLPGLTLGQLVKQHGPLPPARAVHLLRQVCGALREAHGIGLIHRDIKPGNVVVCQRGGVPDVAKLLDFGLVLPQECGDGERLTHQGAVAGTPAYMSPEQAEGREDLDGRSDVYGLGALAYFALTGRPVFAGYSAARALAAHLYEQPEPLTAHRPDVPADVQAVVLRCLAKDPAGRFPGAEDLEAALAACASAGQWSAKEAAAWWQEWGSPGERV
jgi:serine/threonine-protein kinase